MLLNFSKLRRLNSLSKTLFPECALVCTILSLFSHHFSSGFSGMKANKTASGAGFEFETWRRVSNSKNVSIFVWFHNISLFSNFPKPSKTLREKFKYLGRKSQSWGKTSKTPNPNQTQNPYSNPNSNTFPA